MLVRHGSLDLPGRADRAYETAKHYLCRDGAERAIFGKLEHRAPGIHLRINSRNDDSYDSTTRTIHWDPYSALRTTRGGHQTPALGLGHEADHATVGSARLIDGWNRSNRRYDDAEERRVICGSEAHAARTLGESVRHDHQGRCYRVAGPLAR
ncbi:MAG: hypothetical protein M3126_01710 [Candidatus Eremiobacteraeota bacterium]|nr:hypothetical protein [Candidatus Eremiobacteraeota bacterium]